MNHSSLWRIAVALPAAILLSATPTIAGVDAFSIGLEQEVSDGMPGPGAGNIETTSSQDVYTLTVPAGTQVYFEELSGQCGLRWQLEDPAEQLLFQNSPMCSADPGAFTLTDGGDYTITVFSAGSATGTYSFIVWEINPAEEFTIGLEQVVSNGNPDAGAGNIEEPGAVDIYTLNIASLTDVFVQELSGPCGIRWMIEDPLDQLVFLDNAVCSSDPGTYAFNEVGQYTITVFGNGATTGTYSFVIWEINPDDQFAIALEETVSNGAPAGGAGNIEEPGTADVYTLSIASPVEVYFEELSGPCGIRWMVEDPLNQLVFLDTAICTVDPGVYTLSEVGDYTITVFGNGATTGTYSFVVWELNPPDEFTIAIDEVVANGMPAAGAGNIEEPGAIDIYTLSVASPLSVFANEISGPCGLAWQMQAPDDSFIFQDAVLCSTDPGQFLLDQVGDYTITVFSNGPTTGTYSFEIVAVEAPQFFALAPEQIVSDGVPGVGAGNIENPGSVDIYLLDATAGDQLCFEELSGPCSLRWKLIAPDGNEVFSDTAICATNPGKFIMPQSGTYQIAVFGNQSATGTYSFIVNLGRVADVDGNCYVDVFDLLQLLENWGACDAPCPPYCVEDTNFDCSVDVFDLLEVLTDWG